MKIFQQKSKYEFNKHSTFHSYCTRFNVYEVLSAFFLWNYATLKLKRENTQITKTISHGISQEICYVIHSTVHYNTAKGNTPWQHLHLSTEHNIKRSLHAHSVNPLNTELNPICHLLALLGVHFLHVSRIRVKSLTLRLLMSYICIWSTYSWCF